MGRTHQGLLEGYTSAVTGHDRHHLSAFGMECSPMVWSLRLAWRSIESICGRRVGGSGCGPGISAFIPQKALLLLRLALTSREIAAAPGSARPKVVRDSEGRRCG
eukprot:Skav213007  [mRNA]  locus=scaffold561:28803:32114:+ [translate_table: standard]